VDILVALSYPDRFVVERTRDSRATGGGFFFNDPFFLDYGFLSPLDGAFYAPYYYSPFAYSSYGRFYNPGFYNSGFFGPGNIAVGGSSEPQPSGDGRVVNGLGYTRIRERAAEGGVSTASRAGSSGAGAASSGSSSGGSVTSQGFSSGGSSGGSGGDGGRSAVPR
jgi:hypothetical protein